MWENPLLILEIIMIYCLGPPIENSSWIVNLKMRSWDTMVEASKFIRIIENPLLTVKIILCSVAIFSKIRTYNIWRYEL